MTAVAHYPNYVYSIFSFLGFLMVTIPLPWHLEAWNVGTCLYMIWTAIGCLNYFVNSIVWNGNAINWSPIWCDISARIIIANNVAIPAASLVINRRLYYISCCNSVTTSKSEKRRSMIFDLLIGVGLPFLAMALQYISQGHRFNIFEDVGCFPATYNTPMAFPTVWLLPLIIGGISAVYSILSVRAFAKRRAAVKEVLSMHSNLNAGRYLRLMLLGGVDTVCYVPFSIWAIVVNANPANLQPWISWEDTHYGFSRVDQVPGILWRNASVSNSIDMTRWLLVACAFMFFLFFGFADEAQKHYRIAFESVAKHVGYSTMSASTASTSKTGMSSNGKSSVLPVFIRRDVRRQRDSFDSFSDLSASQLSATNGTFDEKEKSGSFGAVSFLDVGGLSPTKPGDESNKDSASSASSSLPPSPDDVYAPTLPKPIHAITRPSSILTIEIPSILEIRVGSPHPSAVSPHSSIEEESPVSTPDRVLHSSSPPRPHRRDSLNNIVPNVV